MIQLTKSDVLYKTHIYIYKHRAQSTINLGLKSKLRLPKL